MVMVVGCIKLVVGVIVSDWVKAGQRPGPHQSQYHLQIFIRPGIRCPAPGTAVTTTGTHGTRVQTNDISVGYNIPYTCQKTLFL